MSASVPPLWISDPGQVLERRCLIIGTEPGQCCAELSEPSEAVRIAVLLDLGERGMRQEPEQPPVARPDDVQHQQRTRPADQRRTPMTGPCDPRISDLVLPPGAMIVESARDPTLLPRVTVEAGQPVQHHDQTASSLTIELAERHPFVVVDERVEAGQHRVTVSVGLQPHR